VPRSTHFAENDPVRSPAESGLQKVVERDVGLERVGLAFDRQNVRLLDVKLGGVLNDDVSRVRFSRLSAFFTSLNHFSTTS